MYADRFWKKNWDEGLEDLDPHEFETTYVEMTRRAFEQVPDKIALGFLGVDISFRELDRYANQFANLLLENGFGKGDIVSINLPNLPEYVISLIC
jgi:long-chain acyl-CoA synthetase